MSELAETDMTSRFVSLQLLPVRELHLAGWQFHYSDGIPSCVLFCHDFLSSVVLLMFLYDHWHTLDVFPPLLPLENATLFKPLSGSDLLWVKKKMGVLLPRVQCKSSSSPSQQIEHCIYVACTSVSFCIPFLASHLFSDQTKKNLDQQKSNSHQLQTFSSLGPVRWRCDELEMAIK